METQNTAAQDPSGGPFGSCQLVDSKEPTSLEFPWRSTRALWLPGLVGNPYPYKPRLSLE